jgi:hypothetical protein
VSSRLGCKDSPLGVEVAPLGSSWHDEERAARGVCERTQVLPWIKRPNGP